MDLGWALAFLPYGDHWRRGRKLFHSQTHAGACVQYQTMQLRGARRLVADLNSSSSGHMAVLPRLIRTNMGVTAMEMVYGIKLRGPVIKARFLDAPETVTRAISEAATPSHFLLDFFPIREL
jgi:hypothetical protein